ncbi:ferredoxin [Nocardia sp. NPDC051321]|uniref:ferredoxin n=1 Tax=Nocardia sp. NPDC051321 TaxID=3364323 RepID=UPI003793BA80
MLRADRSRCCGAGMCVLIDSTVFQQDESGLVVIDVDAARAADPALLRHAVSCCPGQALSLTRTESANAAANQRE